MQQSFNVLYIKVNQIIEDLDVCYKQLYATSSYVLQVAVCYK